MKVFKIQKQGFALDKDKGTFSTFGMSFCCFEDNKPFPKEKFVDKEPEKEMFEDFYDEDSE